MVDTLRHVAPESDMLLHTTLESEAVQIGVAGRILLYSRTADVDGIQQLNFVTRENRIVDLGSIGSCIAMS